MVTYEEAAEKLKDAARPESIERRRKEREMEEAHRKHEAEESAAEEKLEHELRKKESDERKASRRETFEMDRERVRKLKSAEAEAERIAKEQREAAGEEGSTTYFKEMAKRNAKREPYTPMEPITATTIGKKAVSLGSSLIDKADKFIPNRPERYGSPLSKPVRFQQPSHQRYSKKYGKSQQSRRTQPRNFTTGISMQASPIAPTFPSFQAPKATFSPKPMRSTTPSFPRLDIAPPKYGESKFAKNKGRIGELNLGISSPFGKEKTNPLKGRKGLRLW